MPPKKKREVEEGGVADLPAAAGAGEGTRDSNDDDAIEAIEPAKKKKPAKKPKVELPDVIPQSDAPRAEPPGSTPPGAKRFKAISWNVAGLRALLDKNSHTLRRIADVESPDVICVQEHKLQDVHVDDAVRRLGEILPEYRTVKFAVSTAKKGYSGVAILARAPLATASASSPRHREPEPAKPPAARQGTLLGFVKKAAPASSTAADGGAANRERQPHPNISADPGHAGELLRVVEGMGDFRPGYTDEGRVLTLEFDAFNLVFTYVPNSGQKLERLEYRLKNWDVDFRAYLRHLDGETRGKPVIVGGDLNVGHLDEDIYNVDAPHTKKQCGLTPEERASWTRTLEEVRLVDTFRAFHPNARGWYSYWSGRAGNKPRNRGLRLDYFAASERIAAGAGGGAGVRVVDSFVLDKLVAEASDHAPVGITLALD
jgi:exodeoxyribonuclease III